MWWWEEGDRHKLALTFPQWIQAWLDGHLTHKFMAARQLRDESWVGPWANEQPYGRRALEWEGPGGHGER
ncbi:hypothetical protein, partial [Streptomyces sp. NPDC058092]|uniref:hypothetical protein n=1 Tax=Streptomyces sp. NPDC058092 TaxID=3346336 RepID=UPI0036F0F6DE